MRKYLLILISLWLQSALHAQTKGQARIDSLVHVLQTTTQDTTRVRTLNTLATDLLRVNPDSALALSSAALRLSKDINYPFGEAISYFSSGQVYAAESKAEDALSHFGNALKLFEMIRYPVGVADATYAMGLIHQRTNYEEALSLFKTALETAQQTTDTNLMGKTASVIANTYLRIGDYHKALPYNDLAITYYSASGNQTGLANCLVASSRMNHRRGNIQQALKDDYAALRIYEQSGSLVGIYNVHTGLGLIYEDQKNYNEALTSYLAAKDAAEAFGSREVLANAYVNVGNAYRELGRLTEALQVFEESLSLAEQTGSKKTIAISQGNLGTIYSRLDRPEEALKSYEQAMQLFEEIGAQESLGIAYFETGAVYFDLKQPEESRLWLEKALEVAKRSNNKEVLSQTYFLLMQIDTAQGDYISALENHRLHITYRDSITNAEAAKQLIEQSMQYAFSKKEDSLRLEQALIAEQLDKQTLLTTQQQQELRLKQASLELARREKDLQMLSFLKTQAELQLGNEQKEKELKLAEQNIVLQESELERQTLLSRQKEQSLLLKDKELVVQRTQRNIWLAGAIALLLISFVIFRNYRNQRKANVLLQQQQAKTEQALQDLKATQTQLIHAEKMASLGELTAGIAHEIQNPLNFVNNFSELNNEMIDEMQQELQAGKIEDALVIAQDIIDNNSKISHHGKRAEGIVKGMLQHTRTGSRKKESVDINGLVDEYLRLSYHGLRAKDKTFNATFTTDLDERIKEIEVVPQEIGRVLLNLYNNAFYACAERSRSAVHEKEKQPGGSYEPTVSVTTKKSGDHIEITILDNGTGIPQKVLNKIYQPFFTTKPPGQGTGLGLSLSYDIIKAHGGELQVETQEEEFTKFVIRLPVFQDSGKDSGVGNQKPVISKR